MEVLWVIHLSIWIFWIAGCSCLDSPTPDNHYINQDGFIVENTLQGSEQAIHLEDFFWTGSGDGPPPLYVPKPISSINDGSKSSNRDFYVKTATILATVYVDGQSEMDEDPLCVFNCHTDQQHSSEEQILQNSTISYARNDRRFWLLTVVAGYFSASEIPLIEDKLAKLYRVAFSRQQAQHLGLRNESKQNFSSIVIEPTNRRRRRDLEDKIKPTRTLPLDRDSSITQELKETNQKAQIQPNGHLAPNKVKVIIHNMTYLSEEEIQRRSLDNQVDFIDINSPYEKRNSSVNQTEFIYTVFVGNKPVIAMTAADDMKLVTNSEAMSTFGNTVFTKSEPYLKEPLATPLVPASTKKDSNGLAFITENPIMFGITCAAIFLLICLLVGILFMSKSKRDVNRNSEIRRLATERLSGQQPKPVRTIELIREEKPPGRDNQAFDNDELDVGPKKHRRYDSPPAIHFPLPPINRPSSSSSATSDSSVYYNKRYKDESKTIISEKPTALFHKRHHRRENEVIQTEDNYAVVSKHNEKTKAHRHKRRYMGENRVGSVEDTKTMVQTSTSASSPDSENTYAAPVHYNPNEAYNLPMGATSQRHLIRKAMMAKDDDEPFNDDFEVASSLIESPNEAVNREILKALAKDDLYSADSGSIGSFLSMASIKSFPKCSVPEPLSRVLEPVTMTHYDQSDYDEKGRKIFKPSSSHVYKHHVINNFISNGRKNYPKSPDEPHLVRSQSDGSDPGIVGPVVWELHRKEMGKQNSPLRDPTITRNRFEGLLEGAIKLYEGTDDREVGHRRRPSVSISKNENRGKSAIIVNAKPKAGILRPVTAGHSQDDIEELTSPHSPTRKAWGSGAPSPLVRPLSAGPFHRPEPPAIDVTRVLAPQYSHSDAVQMSTAPLIEAIQYELKKFNRTESNNSK